ncbi:MAG: serine protease [Pseudomonadales bacterium]
MITSAKNQTLRLIITIVLLNSGVSFAQSQTASTLFDRYSSGVVQVRTIDLASGDKTSIGSGFSVDGGRYVATNFHVVSLLIHAPETYRLELVDDEGETIEATVAAIDVIHDLALLSPAREVTRSLRLRTTTPSQGDRIFSLGNPQDLGMTIIEGNYNGLVKKSRYQKILFSGSLNSGMSGGPAIDSRGRVLGINVSKGGEQISFLVPAEQLQFVIDKARRANLGSDNSSEFQRPDFVEQIRTALYNDQSTFYSKLLEDDWSLETFGGLMLPQKISNTLKCWGHTVEDDDLLYESFHQHCQSNDAIYIDDNFYTGQFEYDFEWLESNELNTFQFYNAVERRFSHKSQHSGSDEEDVSEYQCNTDIVSIADSRWKVSSCFRAYQSYDDLYDALLLMAALDSNNTSAVLKASATGISQNSATALFAKLMGAIAWKP